ncbi:MAG: Asp-tRNA(Asn)/Glu-tRNA(Gln) amidotransferase subunit GatA [Sedimentisphaerales bacterium]|nr:Asp-tRNA(Asn)/Glu-tRNA(Gln) amidotransferase subunit GatA [Sedimentisphaerales bacterium]
MLEELSARQLRDKIVRGEVKSLEATESVFERIEQRDPVVGAYICICKDEALDKAAAVDRRIAAGEQVGALAGVPIAIKDNFCTTFRETTCASKILENFKAPYNAGVVERLEAADAVIVGKCNMDEFAMGSSCENSALKQTVNPWDTSRVPGGSSGGSAAAVAARMCYASLGSDTGGSIRLPACFCGVVGMKPTYGRVSRYGLVAYGSSLDQIGPFATTIEDAALLMNVIAGHDPRDSTSVSEDLAPVADCLADLEKPVEGLKIGVAREFFDVEGLHRDVEQAIRAALKVYEGQGATLVDVSLPHMKYAIAAYYLIATAEASSNLARYDGVHYGHRTANPKDYIDVYNASRAEGFGPEVKRRIMLGTYALSAGYYDAYYLKALKVRNLIRQDFIKAFEQVDCLICPTSPEPAFRIGAKMDDPLTMYLSDIYTIACNLAGIPGLSIPCGFSSDELPVGLQILSGTFTEAKLLRIARIFEKETNYHNQKPKFIETKG